MVCKGCEEAIIRYFVKEIGDMMWGYDDINNNKAKSI